MKLLLTVTIVAAVAVLATAHKNKGGKSKGQEVVLVESYPQRQPVYDYPVRRPSYDYAPSYSNYVEYPVHVSHSKKSKHHKKQQVHFIERPRPYYSYDYGDYDDYYVPSRPRKTKHVHTSYQEYRRPVYYQPPKEKKGECGSLLFLADANSCEKKIVYQAITTQEHTFKRRM
ncbi:uncharacterized protein LOC144158394 isoform X1 [Haemaphysalis longicornis]